MGLFDNNYREDVHRRNSKVVRDRKAAWDFILTWSDALFHRQFFIAKVDFLLCYPAIPSVLSSAAGLSADGGAEYMLSHSAEQLGCTNRCAIRATIYYNYIIIARENYCNRQQHTFVTKGISISRSSIWLQGR